MTALQNAVQPVYAAKQKKENPQSEEAQPTAESDDTVVDAEFTEVDDTTK
jgi:hypothetical protein